MKQKTLDTNTPLPLHIIYTHNGVVKQAYKRYTFKQAEAILSRLGATYWEIGI